MSTLKLENLQHPDAAGTSISLASSGAISFASDVAFNTDTFYVDTANGRVGIGTTSPARSLHVVSTDLISARFEVSNGNYIETLYDGINVVRTGDAFFSNTSSSANNIQYRAGSSGAHIFKALNTERMRIDSSGNLLVGTTNANIIGDNEVGARLSADGRGFNSADGNIVLYLNRKTSDGTIVDIRKDGTTVGTIGASSSQVYIAGTGVGLKCGTANLRPTNGSGSTSDNSVDLGSGSFRFKDLYLSGGVYVGGTTSANYLDDYEEGTWTPSFVGGINGVTYGSQNGYYRKVGNLVTYNLFVDINSGTTSGAKIEIGGLPFTSESGPSLTGGAFLLLQTILF
jgi:hypothetical protein